MKFMNSKLVNDAVGELRANRKLQFGLLGIALILCVDGGLRWTDSLSAREKQLQELRSELRLLRGQSRDEDDLKRQLASLDSAQKDLEERLWVVSSEAVGQAQLQDWLLGVLKKVDAKNYKLILSSPRAVSKADAEGEKQVAKKTEASGQRVSDLRDFRANVSMQFSPESLERLLQEIEGGQPLAIVESLMVKRQERKVDLSVRVLMRIGEQNAPAGVSDIRSNEPAGSVQ